MTLFNDCHFDYFVLESDILFDELMQSPVKVNALAESASKVNVTSNTIPKTEEGKIWYAILDHFLNSQFSEDEKVVCVPPVIILPDNTEQCVPLKSDFTVSVIIKSLIQFLANRQNTSLWNYEDITAKVWVIRSAEQIDIFLQYILKVFQVSLPAAHINERWAQTALQLGLSCSSRHYAGRSLQIYRSLRVPISSRMLSDILSRLVETIAEQGEDMQGKDFLKFYFRK